MMIDLPKNEGELESYLHAVTKLRDASDFEAALQACDPLIEDASTRNAGLRARADIYADMREPEKELADREKLIGSESQEPSDYFDIGILLWKTNRLAEAASAFSRSLEIGEEEDFHYYTNSSRMHLVGVLIAMQRREEALSECTLLPDDYSSYLPTGMATKEQFLEKLRLM